MMGIVFSIIAGMAMSIQGVMNTRLGEHIGTMEANTIVQCTAAVLSLAALAVSHGGSFAALGETPKLYWFGGVLGLVITVTVMLGIRDLSPTVSISVILISQLLVAALIDAFGLMGSERVAFGWSKYAGLVLMAGGVLLFKLKN
ncbi:MAG: DMT family transporter [Ruminococcaceae bacterium]|nr:DMT family transporter [Oscillospiraceae bacterium]